MDHFYYKYMHINIKDFIKFVAQSTDNEIVSQVRKSIDLIDGQRIGEGALSFSINKDSIKNIFFMSLVEQEKEILIDNDDSEALEVVNNSIQLSIKKD